jgi:hypothetical protein
MRRKGVVRRRGTEKCGDTHWFGNMYVGAGWMGNAGLELSWCGGCKG